MKLKVVVVDLEIPKPIKRRLLLAGIPTVALLALGGIALATVPHTFSNGQVLNATDLNDNFSGLDSRVTAIEKHPVKKVGNVSYSLDATYCGKTAPVNGAVTNNNLTGWAAVKDLCQTSCASPSAHLCTGGELIRSVQMGVKPETGAYASESAFVGNNAISLDCQGWSSAAATAFSNVNYTPIWDSNGQYPTVFSTCATQYPLLCCD